MTDRMARSLGVQPPPEENCAVIPCPYGVAGDRLWVRETFDKRAMDKSHRDYAYRATCCRSPLGMFGDKWTPSIHMPSWASRILLDIVSVRVERLQDISEADAIAEGIERDSKYPTLWKRGELHGDQNTVKVTAFPKLAYRSIWESINGPLSWAQNPWVWVVEFKRVMP